MYGTFSPWSFLPVPSDKSFAADGAGHSNGHAWAHITECIRIAPVKPFYLGRNAYHQWGTSLAALRI
eukprot:8243-Eustigmatos_ZCMA.PRE.1